MKNFYLLKLGKSQSILNTSSQMLYKGTGAPREADTRPGKDNKYSNAWIVLPTACFWRCFGFIS